MIEKPCREVRNKITKKLQDVRIKQVAEQGGKDSTGYYYPHNNPSRTWQRQDSNRSLQLSEGVYFAA